MPTYEYECTKCGCVFDLFQSIKEPPRKRLKKSDPRPCDCNAPVARRITGGGGLIFRGSGFYLTDYRSESYKQAAKAETDAPKSGENTDGKAEPAKPAKNAESNSAERPAGKKKKRSSEE